MSTETIMGEIIAGLVILCITIAIQLAKAELKLKYMDEELQRFAPEADSIKNHAKKTVLDIQERHDKTVKEITERYRQETENLKKSIEHIKNAPLMLLVKRPKK